MNIILTIFRTQNDYHAVIGIGEFPKSLSSKEVVYQDIQEGEGTADSRTVIWKMQKKAKEWARKKRIDFVHNLDFDTYP